ncbi:TetR/AcrR family transcriptional regulator [Embleya hyalina]|uniref:TetR family transcriptional regulator n=1 Tax=Embleya hyalina TaxID=516124 RepID=A0A401YF81_9ACTN|nr:TetR/AcrR family transcriptional regulator [Embleya hyalina]GCD93239.1 TetR family transcriptional regulator [Embleya hyalina]
MAKGNHRNYHHGELRDALLDAAETLVHERGVEGWSLREASARVGVSPSAAYHHFASRDALVRALSERVLARLGERMSAAAGHEPERGSEPDSESDSEPDAEPDSDPQERLVAVGRSYVRWALEEPAVARLAFGAGATDPDTSISPHPHDVLDAELDRLVDAGCLGVSARPGAEFVVWAAVHGLATLLADGLVSLDGPQAVDREAERVVRAVLGGLTQETAVSPTWPTARSAHTERLAERRAGGSSARGGIGR